MGNQQSDEKVPTGRQPNDREMMALLKLQKKLFARLVESPAHLALLERYWRASCCTGNDAPQFVRSSPLWHKRGGFSSDSPAGELRCTGELGLRCLVAFAETYPAEASMMKRRRGGYPFVKAATALVRVLSEVFHLVDESGRVSDFPVTRAFYWHVLESEHSFYRLFALLFLHFEELYCEQVARNRALLDVDVCPIAVVVKLVDETKRSLVAALSQAPSSLDELRSLCSNGASVLDVKTAIGVDDPSPAGTTTTSRWNERAAQRRSMRELGKNWGKPRRSEPQIGVIRPGVILKPRVPDIVLGKVDNQSASDGDDTRDDLSDSVGSSGSSARNGDTNAPRDLDAAPTTKNLFEGLVVSQCSISLSTTTVGSNEVSMRQAAPIS